MDPSKENKQRVRKNVPTAANLLMHEGFNCKAILLYSDYTKCLQKKAIQRRLRDKLGKDIQTDNYEDIIAAEVVNPNSIDVCMDDVGGLEDTKKTLVRFHFFVCVRLCSKIPEGELHSQDYFH